MHIKKLLQASFFYWTVVYFVYSIIASLLFVSLKNKIATGILAFAQMILEKLFSGLLLFLPIIAVGVILGLIVSILFFVATLIFKEKLEKGFLYPIIVSLPINGLAGVMIWKLLNIALIFTAFWKPLSIMFFSCFLFFGCITGLVFYKNIIPNLGKKNTQNVQ